MLDTDVSKCKITANAQYDPRSAEIIARNSSYFNEKFLWRGLRRGGGVMNQMEKTILSPMAMSHMYNSIFGTKLKGL